MLTLLRAGTKSTSPVSEMSYAMFPSTLHRVQIPCDKIFHLSFRVFDFVIFTTYNKVRKDVLLTCKTAEVTKVKQANKLVKATEQWDMKLSE